MKIIKQENNITHLASLDVPEIRATYVVSREPGTFKLIFKPMSRCTLEEIQDAIGKGNLFLTLLPRADDNSITEVIYDDHSEQCD